MGVKVEIDGLQINIPIEVIIIESKYCTIYKYIYIYIFIYIYINIHVYIIFLC